MGEIVNPGPSEGDLQEAGSAVGAIVGTLVGGEFLGPAGASVLGALGGAVGGDVLIELVNAAGGVVDTFSDVANLASDVFSIGYDDGGGDGGGGGGGEVGGGWDDPHSRDDQ